MIAGGGGHEKEGKRGGIGDGREKRRKISKEISEMRWCTEGGRMAQILGIKRQALLNLKAILSEYGEVARFFNAIQCTKSKEKQI